MPQRLAPSGLAGRLPSWVPQEALTYLEHTEVGTPIRALAREAGVHASTVLRQVRALEARREDLLVDHVLNRLGDRVKTGPVSTPQWPAGAPVPQQTEAEADAEARAMRALAKMARPGRVLAVAVDMDKAVVVEETDAGDTVRRAVVERDVAEVMALKNWIACTTPARISRYRITGAGRAALNRELAQKENAAAGLAEAMGCFEPAPREARSHTGLQDSGQKYHAQETPLALLARRRDRTGRKFLPPELVSVGERLQEDFETAGLVRDPDRTWDQFLADAMEGMGQGSAGADAARARVVGALRDLGPGLGDAALQCCCYLEGLECIEKRFGWSARSGKVVLRIALQRLRRHYDALGDAGAMIG